MVEIIKFGANWCGPCKSIEKTFDELLKEDLGFKYTHIDIDEDTDSLCEKYKVRSIPTVVKLVNGEEVARFVGTKPLNDVRDFITA